MNYQAIHEDMNENVATSADLAEFLTNLFHDLKTQAYSTGDQSYNTGLNIRLDNGAKFQITIIRAEAPTLEPCEECGKMTEDILCTTCEEMEEN